MDEDSFELRRQAFHLVNGLVIAAAVWLLKPLLGFLILAPLVLAVLLMYLVPTMMPDLKAANQLLYHFERREDLKDFPFKGAIMFGIGLIFPLLLLDVRYGCAVIVVFSIGDAFSNIVGRRYGHIKVGERSIEGALAFFLTSWPLAAIILGLNQALVLSLAGAAIELLDRWDDNVTVPLGLSLLVLLLPL